MTANTLQDIILKETQQLPFSLQSEVLDFVLFLKNKKQKTRSEFDELSLSQLQSDEIVHLEEEFANYKDKYPHE